MGNYFSILEKEYASIKNHQLTGRYLPFQKLEAELNKLPGSFRIGQAGISVNKNPIPFIEFGKGATKILAWSQMHGNESTSTKAISDLLNLFSGTDAEPEIATIISSCTIRVIPMLNPDGALSYTRENANGIDLNRDAKKLSQPESRALHGAVEDFQPDFCFNLHDQRSIFGVGATGKPATLSFLAPAMDAERTISGNRETAMKLIASIHKDMQIFLPGQIARFDDSFNINCSGDYFQTYGIPTILFEAGHYQNDYQREESRKYFFFSLFSAIQNITSGDYLKFDSPDYFLIPENKKNFTDILLKNVLFEKKLIDVRLQFEEKLDSGKIKFLPIVQQIEMQPGFFGHRVINCEKQQVKNISGLNIKENEVAEVILLKNTQIKLKI